MDEDRSVTVGFTDLSTQKAERFLSPEWMRYELCRMVESYPRHDAQDLYSKGHYTSEYHLVFPDEDYALVWLDKLDHIVVITQMHMHDDYNSDPIYSYVDESRWKTLFGSRKPASFDRGDAAEHLATNTNKMRLTPATADVSEVPVSKN